MLIDQYILAETRKTGKTICGNNFYIEPRGNCVPKFPVIKQDTPKQGNSKHPVLRLRKLKDDIKLTCPKFE